MRYAVALFVGLGIVAGVYGAVLYQYLTAIGKSLSF